MHFRQLNLGIQKLYKAYMFCSSKPFQLTRTNLFSTYAAQNHLTSELLSFSENKACPMSANFDKKVSFVNNHFLHLNALNMLFSQKDSKSTRCLAHFSKKGVRKIQTFSLFYAGKNFSKRGFNAVWFRRRKHVWP